MYLSRLARQPFKPRKILAAFAVPELRLKTSAVSVLTRFEYSMQC